MRAASVASRPAGRLSGRLQTIAVIVVTAVVIGVVAFIIERPTDDGVTSIDLTGAVSARAPQVGEVPPGFTALTADGAKVSLSDYAGKPMWVTFGASWCADCRSEAPDIEAVYQRYRAQGLVILGVFIDEDAASIAGYAQRAGLTFPIAVDRDTIIAGSYRTLGIPTHFFIGADGRVAQVRIGAMHADEMDRAVAALLN